MRDIHESYDLIGKTGLGDIHSVGYVLRHRKSGAKMNDIRKYFVPLPTYYYFCCYELDNNNHRDYRSDSRLHGDDPDSVGEKSCLVDC